MRTTWVLAAAAVLTARATAGGVLVTCGGNQQARAAQQSPVNTAKVERWELSPSSVYRPGLQRGQAFARVPLWVAPIGPLGESATLQGQELFAAYVAHELRTPIAIQRALAEATLADPGADTAALRAMGEDVVACCEQQQRLIDGLLSLTRTAGGLTRHEPVDIAAITSELMHADDLSRFETLVSFEPARTTGDPDLIERLVANLLSNATRYNLTGGRIEIATRTEAERAVLSIANTGRCIPAAELPRLFQPFQRLPGQSRASAKGLGLGLAIVQAIADAHRAVVTAHAPADGGLKIDVSFPANAEPVVPDGR